MAEFMLSQKPAFSIEAWVLDGDSERPRTFGTVVITETISQIWNVNRRTSFYCAEESFNFEDDDEQHD